MPLKQGALCKPLMTIKIYFGILSFMQDNKELLTRCVANIIPGKESLDSLLQSDQKLNIYFGIDPTMTKIHLGHTVPLRKLQAFAQRGHHVVFLIGDFTALIGDTSDKEAERPILTTEDITSNFQTYKKQAEKILDFSKVEIRRNSEWLATLTFEEVVKLTQHFSVGDFTSRELIKKRLTEGKRVGLHEFLYPVMQGFDSYSLDTDIQIGGTDQTFNMQAGRTLQKDLREKESFVLTSPLLVGNDGRKMSKSLGNAIWVEDEPFDMYRKAMAINDDLIIEYFTLATNVSLNEIEIIARALKNGDEPAIDVKKRLARQIVSELHSVSDAEAAEEAFSRTVQRKELSTEEAEIISYTGNTTEQAETLIFALGVTHSKAEAKRLIEQGGVEVDGKRIENANEEIKLNHTSLVKIGKRRLIKISTSSIQV